MIDSVGTLSVQASALRSSASQSVVASAPQTQQAYPSLVSLRVRVDNQLNKAILEVRSNDTGEVVEQYPSPAQIRAFQRAAQLQAQQAQREEAARQAAAQQQVKAATLSAATFKTATPAAGSSPDTTTASSGNSAAINLPSFSNASSAGSAGTSSPQFTPGVTSFTQTTAPQAGTAKATASPAPQAAPAPVDVNA